LWLDYLMSSLPTLVWCSMLSILLLYFIEMYYRSQLRQPPRLRPVFVALNIVFYAIYACAAVLTWKPSGAASSDLRRAVYFALACAHFLLSVGLLRYGLGLVCRLKQHARSSASALPDAPADPAHRVITLATLLPATELIRTCNDLEYSLGGLPFNLHSGFSSVLFLAGAKLVLEWVPSAAIFCILRPGRQPPSMAISPCCEAQWVDPLLPPYHERCLLR